MAETDKKPATTDHPFESGKLPYGWEDVQMYWPQRLIHIPTMTSVPRNDDNVYQFEDITAKEPQYSTLSYTWGRWRIKDNPKAPPVLDIKNTPWPIPAVKEEHFTPAAMRNVVEIIQKNGVDWAWIDVGCIDQSKDSKQAAIEIGRQASIFKRAKSTYVWLSRLPSQQLSQTLDDIIQYGGQLYHYNNHVTSVVINLDDTMDKLQKAYETLFSDPWFSSLWTLQEFVLRNDAMVFTTEGQSVPWKVERDDQRTYLTMLINECRGAYGELEKVAQTSMTYHFQPLKPLTERAVQRIKELILHAGFYYLFTTNPNVQYGTAHYRTASRDEDRIYAIMQIYNLSVGKSARPGETPSLEELVPEFAGAINRRCAILGQLFLHTTQPKPGYSWQITENSTVPEAFMIYRDPNHRASIEFDPKTGCMARGPCFPLPTLLRALEEVGKLTPDVPDNGWELEFKIFLDSHIDGAASFRTLDKSHYLEQRDPPVRIRCEDVLVLWLGDMKGSFNHRLNMYSRHHVGLLLNPMEVEDALHYKRLGIVEWTTAGHPHEKPVEAISWEEKELKLK